MSQKIKIYHNPACGTSRNTLELIRNTGQEPEIIEYLKIPPTKEELITLIEKSGLSVREAIRKNVEPYEKLELQQEHWTYNQLIGFMLEYPILINRPFVVTDLGIKLCRPSELVLDLLSAPQLNAFSKEDGEIIIDQNGNRVK
ncbi:MULTISPECIES: arsenate reductase (glutaredoxin) [Acinetobacter]|uniref:Arsenate reductase n=1 Tax=Acinetobacter ursingii TaxID=108980 RepID=A0A7T9UFI9_9GAMM|nr:MULTISPECIES: arsenate reductase (glutaredoxin) [Acinetobacter]ENX45132.1 arsenate reductase (glutaredoxin) [Acinetobacter ursingii NIPH 706]MBV6552585.1 arsenate reductase (glutaredoxin) [Acinetobacter soli]MCE6008751.1 arsenate reductase (glutaredoxin) [Acinetobacter soli]MCU4524896.1 arsenate reductase (glutaredoxin) [Acinetobacter ursingii]QQT84913.1 arsenate reductase (glutaredoxin) [Acinetobacter ursingii]